MKLFASTVDAGKVERALDLVDRLHLEKSYDLAIQLADHQRKLADLIEDAKLQKFSGLAGDEEEDDYSSPSQSFMDRLETRQISPENSHNIRIKRSMGERSEKAVKKVRLGR